MKKSKKPEERKKKLITNEPVGRVRGFAFLHATSKIKKKSKYGVFLVERTSHYSGRDPVTFFHVCESPSLDALHLGAPMESYQQAVEAFQAVEEARRQAA
jgi:hypothetical protein